MGTIAHYSNFVVPILWWALTVAGIRAFLKRKVLPAVAIAVGSFLLALFGTLNAIFPPGATFDSEGKVLRIVDPLVPALLSVNASFVGLILVAGGVLAMLRGVEAKDGP